VLIVTPGPCEIDITIMERELVATRQLHQGDIMLMSMGHGFRMIEDTVFLEVSRGLHCRREKERF